jgi:hypothetical protein
VSLDDPFVNRTTLAEIIRVDNEKASGFQSIL